ncbi:MAG: hypothetical protein AAF985_01420 [Bacteroidota bacterium]
MKKFCLIILWTCCYLNLFAQATQKGLVREMNSGKKPLSGVSLRFYAAKTTESDMEGKFTLTFDRKKKPGDVISVERIEKQGYEIVNEQELNVLRFSSDGRLPTDIILAKAGVIKEAKLAYADASFNSLKAGYEREKKTLMAQLRAAQINEKVYSEALQQLQKDFEFQQKQLDELANTFARINFDDVSPIYKEALELYKEGLLDAAVAKLESIDLAKQTHDILRERDRIDQAKSTLSGEERLLREKKRNHIDMLISLADMYSIQFKSKRAAGIIDTLLLLDSTDVKVLQKALRFYYKQRKYQKVLHYSPMLIEHPQGKAKQVAAGFSYLGAVYLDIGETERALENLKICHTHYRALYAADSTDYYKDKIATIYQYLGMAYNTLGDLDQTLIHYEQFRHHKKFNVLIFLLGFIKTFHFPTF